jgi:mono/diheme cytochrome c family protein
MRRILAALILCAIVALAGWSLRRDLPAAERGRRLAEREGCFGCHTHDGVRGAANPGRTDRSVPTYEGDLMMYARDAGETRQWIADGVAARRAASVTWKRERDAGTLRMPAFGHRLRPAEIDDLVAFVEATAGRPEPGDSLVKAGLQRADDLGCTACHGPGGRLARPNPGSFKGYVPSWDGRDFGELVRDRAEFDEWVGDGVSRRFAANPAARMFLERATLRMPAFRRHLAAGDLDALWAYVSWLRAGTP